MLQPVGTNLNSPLTRRDMLQRCGMGFGAVALAGLMEQAGLLSPAAAASPTLPSVAVERR